MKKKIQTKKKNKPDDQNEQYKVILVTLGLEYNGQGKTIDDAIASLEVGWNQIKNKGVIKIIKGNYSYEHLFNMKILRMIFVNKIARSLWAKRLDFLFKGKGTAMMDANNL